jgi:hypothetical protein
MATLRLTLLYASLVSWRPWHLRRWHRRWRRAKRRCALLPRLRWRAWGVVIGDDRCLRQRTAGGGRKCHSSAAARARVGGINWRQAGAGVISERTRTRIWWW